MRVRIDIGLDFDGRHTFKWTPSGAAGAVDVPYAVLQRWSQERDGYTRARDRWAAVVDEIEEYLLASTEAETKAVAITSAAPSVRD